MAELRPYPFAPLVTRMFRELAREDAIFHLPRRKFFLGDPARDLGLRFHGHRASSPLGPAAGPQSQMAQNIVLSWLGGARILELKTVQIDDRLTIPRPCIDMQTVGYNVEWSQELTLEESLEEYVKGSMLIEILVASGELELAPGFGDTILDMSVGYDLAGICSERVQAFIRGMLDCGELVGKLRAQIPEEFARYRQLDFRTRLSDTLTLSTFHGCPSDEIESIVDFLLKRNGLHCIVKLNPTLLGPRRTRELLHDRLGYDELRVPERAFECDTTWDQMSGFVERLGSSADGLGLGFGVKFTNTLIVENHRDFFPAGEGEMYLSGAPLHVLAMELVGRFRRQFGDRFPISFSAGIDRKNFPFAVALGLVPVTVCSDLLKPGGYGRACGYFDELVRRMEESGANDLDDYVIRARGLGAAALELLGLPADSVERQQCERALADGGALAGALPAELHRRWVSQASLLNTEQYIRALPDDPRYRRQATDKPPRKIGSELELFDCINCDKCLPVCPNDANFSFSLEPIEIPVVKLRKRDNAWIQHTEGVLKIERSHQIANFADFCNDCGNCDVFCPEDGGPYVVKPRFFGRLEDWRLFSHLDGFHADAGGIRGRFGGREYCLEHDGSYSIYSGSGFRLELDPTRPQEPIGGAAQGEVDLVYYHLLRWILEAVFAAGELCYPALIQGASKSE